MSDAFADITLYAPVAADVDVFDDAQIDILANAPTPIAIMPMGERGPIGAAGVAGAPGPQGPAGSSGLVPPGRIITSGANIAITKDDSVVIVASPNAVAISLPSDAADLQMFFIKDALGVCATKPIQIASTTGLIDGQPTFALAVNYQSLTLAHVAGTWSII